MLVIIRFLFFEKRKKALFDFVCVCSSLFFDKREKGSKQGSNIMSMYTHTHVVRQLHSFEIDGQVNEMN